MLTVATCFWTANAKSAPSSRCYDETWVDRLARGFARNLTIPHRFVALTDKPYAFAAGVEQERLTAAEPGWECMIEPFRIEGPLIVVGLDTIVRSNIDHLARWCFTGNKIALPRSPGKPYACNGVALVPPGQTGIHARWRGENDMEWLRAQPHVFIDDLWPEQVVSFKQYARPRGPRSSRIVYFHGDPKPHQLADVPWVAEHWR